MGLTAWIRAVISTSCPREASIVSGCWKRTSIAGGSLTVIDFCSIHPFSSYTTTSCGPARIGVSSPRGTGTPPSTEYWNIDPVPPEAEVMVNGVISEAHTYELQSL